MWYDIYKYKISYNIFFSGFGYGTFTRTCIKGYTGKSCRQKCPYPHFGSLCHEKCDCIKSFCNHIYGCKKSGKTYKKLETEHVY